MRHNTTNKKVKKHDLNVDDDDDLDINNMTEYITDVIQNWNDIQIYNGNVT